MIVMGYKIIYKANDVIDTPTLQDKIRMFYELKLVGMRDVSVSADDEVSIITIRWHDKPVDFVTFVRVYVNIKQIKKIKLGSETPLFDDDELKFFDKLDFKLEPDYARRTKQDITDWFSKGLDSGAPTLQQKINEFYDKKLKGENKTVHYAVNPNSDVFRIRWKVSDDGEYIVRAWLKDKVVMKTSSVFPGCLYFENDELQFFDRLGFDLHAVQRNNTKQDITDWFGVDNEKV